MSDDGQVNEITETLNSLLNDKDPRISAWVLIRFACASLVKADVHPVRCIEFFSEQLQQAYEAEHSIKH